MKHSDIAPLCETVPAWVDGRLHPVEKLEAHRRGLRHMAVSVFLRVDGKLLLQRRALGKYHTPGLWANTCCTHPHWREDPRACAGRRLNEELGIAGIGLNHRAVIEYQADVGNGLYEHEVVDVFLAEPSQRPWLYPNPEEVMDVRWIKPGRLLDEIEAEPQRFTPWLRIYMARYAKQILGNIVGS